MDLIVDVMDVPKWTGSVGNPLDYVAQASSGIRPALSNWADSCVAAYQMNTNACPFAGTSMKASNPSSDILSRINNIVSKLTQTPFFNNSDVGVITLRNFADGIPDFLSDPTSWYDLAIFLSEIENTVVNPNSHKRRALSAIGEVDYTSYNWTDPIFGITNVFHRPALMCLDNNFTSISTQDSFLSYLQKEIAADDLTGYRDANFLRAACLTWPNFTTSNDIERYNTTFPHLNGTSKILLVAPMHSPYFPVAGVLSTYEFVGTENANVLLHDGYGNGWQSDPNNCTVNAMTNFFTHGIVSLSSQS
jgi:TAP-like protein